MIALDASAIVAIAMEEPEEEVFDRIISWREAIVGVPTLFEARLVLAGRMPGFAAAFMEGFVSVRDVRAVDFTMDMYREAVGALERFGKGRGHPAQLNFGDCMAYAVAKVYDLPLLYKGDDFARTDIRSALP